MFRCGRLSGESRLLPARDANAERVGPNGLDSVPFDLLVEAVGGLDLEVVDPATESAAKVHVRSRVGVIAGSAGAIPLLLDVHQKHPGDFLVGKNRSV